MKMIGKTDLAKQEFFGGGGRGKGPSCKIEKIKIIVEPNNLKPHM